MKSFFSLLLFSCLVLCGLGSFSLKWGFFGHKRINRMAVFTLPPELFPLYKAHIEYITEHAPDADKRRYAVEGEAENHYIDLDRYYTGKGNLFDTLPMKWEQAVAKFTEDTLRSHGILPWNLEKVFYHLVKAYREKNLEQILKYSADIGHYVGDAHVPLHTTRNYNGQLTGQYGIHGFWESRLPELFADNYDYFVGKAQYIAYPPEVIWTAVLESFSLKDTVLLLERKLHDDFSPDAIYSVETRGRTTLKVYSYEYATAYHTLLEGMVEQRMRSSILRLGSFWYSAWVKAGKPDVKEIMNQSVHEEEMKKEYELLEQQYQIGQKKGRVCD